MAAVAGCGWAGFVVGPVVIGAIASTTTLHTALFLIPISDGYRRCVHGDGEGAATPGVFMNDWRGPGAKPVNALSS